MSTLRHRAVRALRRWRALEESIAANTHQARQMEVRKAQSELEQAQAEVNQLGGRYVVATQPGVIDLDRVAQLHAIADVLQQRVQTANQVVEGSKEALAHARDAYIHARTHSRLAADREMEIAKGLADEHEKRMFDQASDMLIARGRRR